MHAALKWMLLGLFIATVACHEPDCEQIVPSCEFVDFIAYGDSAHLQFSFKDCDGDIGLATTDTAPPYEYNVFLTYFEQQNGEWVERTDLGDWNDYRTPWLTPDGRNKQLEGTITISLEPFYYDPLSSWDTIKYEMYLVDRALNESNIIETPAIVKP